MNRQHRLISLAVLIIGLCFVSSTLFAQGWITTGKRLFENDEYQKCITLAEKHKKNHLAIMLLAFSHLQENIFNNTKYDQEKYKGYRNMLEAKLGTKDVHNLLYFINLNDKPKVVEEARKAGWLVTSDLPEENLANLRMAAGNKKKRAWAAAEEGGLLNTDGDSSRAAIRVNSKALTA